MNMQTIGARMDALKNKSLKQVASVLLLIAYLGAVIYAEVRNYNLLTKTIAPDLMVFALLGIVILGIMAIALPIFLHYSSEPGKERIFAYLLYAADIGMMTANAIIDANLNTTGEATQQMRMWATYGVPSVPLFMLAGIGILWSLSPAQKERDVKQQMKSATRDALLDSVKAYTESEEVHNQIRDAAAAYTHTILTDALGNIVARANQRIIIPGKARDPKPTRSTKLARAAQTDTLPTKVIDAESDVDEDRVAEVTRLVREQLGIIQDAKTNSPKANGESE